MLTADHDALAVHRLVQAVARTPEPDDPHRQPYEIEEARSQATTLLAASLPDWRNPAGQSAWRVLLPHIEALANHAPPHADTADTAYLLHQTGLFLRDQGEVVLAIEYLERALADAERVPGMDPPVALSSRNNLALTYIDMGDLERAVPMLEQTLNERRRVLGEDHPDTLTSRNNLAQAYEAAWDVDRAIPVYQQTLAVARSTWTP